MKRNSITHKIGIFFDFRGWAGADGLWFLACIAVCVIYALAVYRVEPFINGGDSTDYLNFHYSRPLGYSVFLKIVGVVGAGIIQPALYAMAMVWLAVEAYRASGGSRVLVIALLAGLMINPELNKYHGWIMSESLYGAGLIALAVLSIRFFRAPRWIELAAASLIVGLAITLRPVGYALLPVLVIMVIMQRRNLRCSIVIALMAALLPATLVIGIERGAARIVYGDNSNALLGRHLYAKAAMIPAPPQQGRSPDSLKQALVDALEIDFEPIRATIAKAPDANMQQFLTVYYEKCVQYGCTSDLRARINVSDAIFARAAFDVALERILRNPWAFVKLIGLHYRALWHIYGHDHPALAQQIADFKREHVLPFAERTYEFSTVFPPQRIAIVVRPVIIGVSVLTAGLAVACLIAVFMPPANPLLAVALLSGLAVHTSSLIAAIFGLGVARYTMGQWPSIVISLGCAAFCAWQVFLLRRNTRAADPA